jgi:hypothetical protein
MCLIKHKGGRMVEFSFPCTAVAAGALLTGFIGYVRKKG